MTTPSTSAQGPDESLVTTAMIDAAFRVCPADAASELGTGAMQRIIAAALTASPSPAASPASPSGDAVHEALREAEAAFETIRVILVNELDEPDRRAFWRAVEARNSLRALLWFPEPASLASDATPAPTSGSEDGGERKRLSNKLEEMSIYFERNGMFGSAENARLAAAALSKPASVPDAAELINSGQFGSIDPVASEPAGGDVREALRWVEQNLAAAKRAMKTSAEHSDGRSNFAAHDAHKHLSTIAAALSSSAAPAGAWIANDPEGGPYLTWSEAAAPSYPNPEALYKAAHPAPATVESVRALPYLIHLARQRWDGNWSYTLEELAERWLAGQFHNDAAESDAKAAALAPATEGRKS